MSAELAQAHITAQERLRAIVARGVATVWAGLPGYDEENVDEWLSLVLPIVAAAEHQSVSLTEAFLARSIGRRPLGVDPASLTGAALRAGTAPEEVFRRPFVTIWTALGAGTQWEDAVNAGLARATSTAATNVQLAMRSTLREVGSADDLILGYQRVPDGDACEFCKLVAGQRYHSDQLMPIHNHCGCGVGVITGTERPNFTGRYDRDLAVTRDGLTAEVRQHGELGPVLVNGDQHFTSEQDL